MGRFIDMKPTFETNADTLVFPVKLQTPEFQEAWSKWERHRRGLKKPGHWALMFQEQIKWLSRFPEPTAIEILMQSIRNGWQGLFEPRMGGANGGPSRDNAAQPTTWELKTRLEAKQKLLQTVRNRGHEDAFGFHIRPEDKAEHRRLKDEIAELERKLAQ